MNKIICPNCHEESLESNFTNGLCWDCSLIASGKYTRCPSCGGLRNKGYSRCMSCVTGYKRASVSASSVAADSIPAVSEASVADAHSMRRSGESTLDAGTLDNTGSTMVSRSNLPGQGLKM